MFDFETKQVDKLFSGKTVPIHKQEKNLLATFIKSFLGTILFLGVFLGGGLFFLLVNLQSAVVEKGYQDNGTGFSFKNLSLTLAQLKDVTFSSEDLEKGEDGWINILLLGLPSKDYPGQMLTDSIVVASINPEKNAATFISIPRDLAVQDSGKYTKINSIYAKNRGGEQGTEKLIETLKEVTGLDLRYYVRFDFTGFERLIDSLGGIDVEVRENMYDPNYPTIGYGTEVFEIEEGNHHLDGVTALKYVRTRHTSENDFGRSKRQQQVIEIVYNDFKEKEDIFELGFNTELFSIVKDHIRTNINISDLKAFYSIMQNTDFENINNIVIDNRDSGLLVSGKIGGLGYSLSPKAEDYSDIHAYIKERM